MSLHDDHFDDPFLYDDEDDDYRPAKVICEHCRQRGLIWSEVKPGVFRLFDQQLGQLHKCPPESDFK